MRPRPLSALLVLLALVALVPLAATSPLPSALTRGVSFDARGEFLTGDLVDAVATPAGDLTLLPPFVDHFNGSSLSADWMIDSPAGTVEVAGGSVFLKENGPRMGHIIVDNVRPAVKAYRFEADVQFLKYGRSGAGIDNHALAFWQCTCYGGMLTDVESHRRVVPADLAPHAFVQTYDGAGDFRVLLDGTQILTAFSLVPHSQSIGIGNGYSDHCGCGQWNEMRVDRVAMLPLEAEWRSPRIDLATLLPVGARLPTLAGEIMGSVSWDATTPTGSSVDVFLRTSLDGAQWTPWRPQENGAADPMILLDPTGAPQIARYAEIRVELATADPLIARPALHSISLDFVGAPEVN